MRKALLGAALLVVGCAPATVVANLVVGLTDAPGSLTMYVEIPAESPRRRVASLMDVLGAVDVQIEGDRVGDPIRRSLGKSAFSAAGSASLSIDAVPAGVVTVSAAFKDTIGTTWGTGSAKVTILPSQNSAVTVEIPVTNIAPGNLSVGVKVIEVTSGAIGN